MPPTKEDPAATKNDRRWGSDVTSSSQGLWRRQPERLLCHPLPERLLLRHQVLHLVRRLALHPLLRLLRLRLRQASLLRLPLRVRRTLWAVQSSKW
jgi:hypothetical protein